MPTDAGPIALPSGGVSQGRADTGFGSAYSLNLGSFDKVYDHVRSHDYASWSQTIDVTNVDVVTFRIAMSGASPVARPVELVALGHWDNWLWKSDSWALAYARDGGDLTGTTIGVPNIQPGKFDDCLSFNAAEAVTFGGADLIDAMINTGTVSLWWKPTYTGAPAANQYIFSSSKSDSDRSDELLLYHDTGQNLVWTIYDSSGVQILTGSRALAQVNGQWYHLELGYDVTVATGFGSMLFVDGAKQGATVAGTGVRGGVSEYLAFGRWQTTTNANSFDVDEFQAYDAVQHTTDFDVPTSPLPELFWAFQVLVGGSVFYEDPIYESTDVEYVSRAINVSSLSGSQSFDLRLVAG
jgi:hypothetical protein